MLRRIFLHEYKITLSSKQRKYNHNQSMQLDRLNNLVWSLNPQKEAKTQSLFEYDM